MYQKTEEQRFENFHLSFSGHLDRKNRWVVLAQLIPWDILEAKSARFCSRRMGTPAKPVRMALGALIIKERCGYSDEETVVQIPVSCILAGVLKFKRVNITTLFS